MTVVPEWTVADRVRKAREHAGMDQQQLADMVGVARQTLSNYENGHTRPRRAVLPLIAAACGVDGAWLVSGVLPRKDSNLQPAGYRSPLVVAA